MNARVKGTHQEITGTLEVTYGRGIVLSYDRNDDGQEYADPRDEMERRQGED
jgi:hypothetical protein